MSRSRFLDARLPRPLSDADLEDGSYQAMQTQLQHALLSAEEERSLLLRAHDGDRAARDRLVESNLRLVHTVARHYRGHGVPLPDLVQEGTIGLMRAIDKYDPEQETRLSTYAIRWIRAFCSRSIQQSGIIRESPRVAWNRSLVLRTEQQLALSGEDASDVRLSKETGLSSDWITYVKHGRVMLSLDETTSDARQSLRGDKGGDPLIEAIADVSVPSVEDQVLARLDNEEFIAWLKRSMSEREAAILLLRYGIFTEPQTLRAIAARMDLSYERIRQIETRALGKLRDVLLSSPLASSSIVRDAIAQASTAPPYRVRASKRPVIVPVADQAVNDASLQQTQTDPQSNPVLPASFGVLVGRAIRVPTREVSDTTSRRNHNMRAQSRQKGTSTSTSKRRKTA